MLEQASEWLEYQRLKELSVPAEYVRRDGTRIEVNVTLGKTLFRAEDQYGVTVRTESRDFLIAASELENEPERGDAIVYNGCRYEVLAPNGEPVWRWSGTYHWTRRIHTKETGSILADVSTAMPHGTSESRGPQKVPEACEAGHELRERSVATFRGNEIGGE